MTTDRPGALQGVTVVELGRYIAAPYGGKLLADLGADVVKVEDTSRGDPMRVWQSGDRPYSPQFAAYNRNKRGITLDLKSEPGREALLRLLDRADVLLENFRPGVTQRLGIDWETVSARNRGLIYCSVTGFGPDGPYADRPAYDTIISAMSGMYGMVLDPESPRPAGPAFSDLLSGQYAALAITSALHARSVSGAGQKIDVSMLGAVLGFITEAATSYLDTGEVTRRDTRQRRAQAYGLVGSDGLPFVVHMSVPERFWMAVTDVMGVPHLREDPRFQSRSDRYDNYEALEAELSAVAARRPRQDWLDLLSAADIPTSPINSIDDVFDDPQVQAMDLIEEIPLPGDDRPMRMAGRFATMSDTPIATRRLAPGYGEHNEEVLAELGFDEEARSAMREDGVTT